MAKPSFSIPDELLEEFDDQIDEKRLNGEFDLDTSRSEVVREFMRQWTEGNLNWTLSDSPLTSDDAPTPTAD